MLTMAIRMTIAVLLFDHKIECRDIATDEKMEFAFQNINARQFFAEDKTLHILSEEGLIYRASKNLERTQRVEQINTSVLRISFRRIIEREEHRQLQRRKNGIRSHDQRRSHKIRQKDQVMVASAEFQGESVEKLVAPFYWSKKLESL
jgi:hypothetical protein